MTTDPDRQRLCGVLRRCLWSSSAPSCPKDCRLQHSQVDLHLPRPSSHPGSVKLSSRLPLTHTSPHRRWQTKAKAMQPCPSFKLNGRLSIKDTETKLAVSIESVFVSNGTRNLAWFPNSISVTWGRAGLPEPWPSNLWPGTRGFTNTELPLFLSAPRHQCRCLVLVVDSPRGDPPRISWFSKTRPSEGVWVCIKQAEELKLSWLRELCMYSAS